MPQINRIRVNNIKYNFGTQFYDDFMMRFSCRNTIYDLANGGGKSVLMLLLLQTIIPNCTLDDKQPVEKLFRTAEGSTTIHSLVEWKLDSCDVKNGYRYMTCGFCARKAKDAVLSEENEEHNSANIDYFNYCIFYREFGENDIKNLPLVNGNERITYNGLKNYLKDLERKDFNVEVKIFEKKSDYQSFINDYGIYESQWEIIRGINKTEGHVRTYFENNYKTARKVIEDLLIEEIIEKSYNNRIRKGDASDDMPKTLLDIKDKLLELARRREDMDGYTKQADLLQDFSNKVESFKEIYSKKEELKNLMLNYFLGVKGKVAYQEKLLEEILEKTESLKQEIHNEEKVIAFSDIVMEERSLAELKNLVEELNDEINSIAAEAEGYNEELKAAQTAEDYRDYSGYRQTYLELKEYIDNRHKDRKDISEELKALAAAKYVFVKRKQEEYSARKETLLKDIEKYEIQIDQNKENVKKQDNECARSEGIIKHFEEEINRLETRIKEKMKGTGLLISANAKEESLRLESQASQLINEKNRLENKQSDIKAENERYIKELADVTAELKHLEREEKALRDGVRAVKADEEKINALCNVYLAGFFADSGLEVLTADNLAGLSEAISANYDELLANRENINGNICRLQAFATMIIDKRMPENVKNSRMYDYLDRRYSGKIIAGSDYLNSLSEEEQLQWLEKYPFLPYSILVTQDYEVIERDSNIMSFNDEGVIPVINFNGSETAFEEITEGNEDSFILACMKLEFLYDEASKNAMLKDINEELEMHEHSLNKIMLNLERVKEDNEFVNMYMHSLYEKNKKVKEDAYRVEQERNVCEAKRANLLSDYEEFKEREGEASKQLEGILAELGKVEAEITVLKEIAVLNAENEAYLAGLKEEKDKFNASMKAKRFSEELLSGMKNSYEKLTHEKTHIDEELHRINASWEKDFSLYYEEGADASGNTEGINSKNLSLEQSGKNILSEDISEEELDARFEALKQLVAKELGDITDKEKLMDNCKLNMERIERGMEYRGISLKTAKELSDLGKLVEKSHAQMAEAKNRYDRLLKELTDKERNFNSASAQMNRVEGSVEHARRSLTERFGEMEAIEINNPKLFKDEHSKELLRKNELLKKSVAEEKENNRLYNGYKLMEKDIERIIKTMGIEPEDISVAESRNEISVKDYEAASRAFDRIIKDEQKKRDELFREKDILVEKMLLLSAYELAEELKLSITIPENISDVENLMLGLEDTRDYILLEKSRISRSIADMETIKSNFESRCLQICSNIKAELEQLAKLSKINMDDETITVLSLQIPYVKEEIYTERMSEYINETVNMSENFKTMEEKLKYIKNRLSWKRMFSVIVSDMNSIKLNLYKRERIKDQSRYLRYEEAVGSTGQSQGIYIQFLVSIINYIASINAGGKEAAVLGKTIFIDNPFGAAKDVYIWEPIFKLLKTNHVQLIVPARGATPAITGRFDVNYCLGQKMVGNRQQTVVVDYRSQVKEEELEYEKLKFSQESFDFL